ncbi:MAG: TIGR02452 family protein [Spirochaetales bacterium]
MPKLHFLPCLDSEERATARKRMLDFPIDVAASLGWSAWDAIRKGYYVTKAGEKVDWKEVVQAACDAKISISPDDPLPQRENPLFPETRAQVTNETTLEAAKRLADQGLRPLALNFANGVQPGGGFLSGARAQEEGLCRSSALYATLEGDPMYAAHRKRPRPDSTDWAILSPDVPVFRTDGGTELPQPWLLSFLTCAAPYAPKIGQPESGDLLQKRIHRVLSIARAYGYLALVLGAWGCGAFGNDPHRTARDFRQALETEFCGAFSEIVFAIADYSPERKTLGPFRDVFV